MVRIAWIDTVKGIAISLVVFGHVLGGALARGWVGLADTGRFAYDYIYSFHMPLFFLIAGALAIDSIKASPSRAILSRLGSIAWPYMLWGALLICLEPIIAPFMLFPPNNVTLLESFKRLLLGEASWFLWTLFLAQCILAVAVNITSVSLLLLGSVLISVVPFKQDLGTFGLLVHYMPFLVLGAFFGRGIVNIRCHSIVVSIVIGVFLFCLLFVLVGYHTSEAPGLYLLCGIIGTIACFMVAQSVEATKFNPILVKFGEASLVIFLLHPFFQGAARALVFRVMGSSSYWQLSVPTIAGILGPTLVWVLAKRFGLRWLFRLDLPARFLGPIKAGPDAARS